MNRWWNLALAGVFAWAWLGAPFASAQGTIGGFTPPQNAPPAFSPFLNLNRGGAGAGINYFGMVKPQQQTMQQLATLQYQQNLLAGGGGAVGGLGGNQTVLPSTTGHPVRYFDYSRYFPLGGMPGGMGTTNGIAAGGVPGAGYGQPAMNTGFAPGFGMAPR